MTGDGSSTNPYIIDSFDDFVSKIAETGAYITLDPDATDKIMNVNNSSYSAGITSTLTFACAQIIGNGWTIQNLYSATTGMDLFAAADGNVTSVQDLHFANIVVNIGGGRIFYSSGGRYHFLRCTFSGIYNHGSSTCQLAYGNNSIYANYPIFEFCAMRWQIVGNGETICLFRRVKLTGCNIHLSGALHFGSSYMYLTSSCGVSNTALLGDLTLSTETSYKTAYVFGGATYISYCAIVFSAPSEITVTSSDAASECFLVNDQSTNVTFSAATNVASITKAQAQDAAYLSGIGFPCAEVES